MQAIAGDFVSYEDATRALFVGDRSQLETLMADWSSDIKAYALRLAFGADATTT